ncbi:META domain-containing protein [Actinokineospora inagensis]|uniref:META domain-containing protein n=1 Tax=Actinokineospora inagensis TaxID=103730 RepID=UPI000684D91D|nr:META domain-containing protein [Actinokineospora inagensis]
MRTRLLTPALAVTLILAGCGSSGGSNQPATNGPTPVGKTYAYDSAKDKGTPHALVPGSTVTLTFHDDGRLTANAGCNTIGGTVSLSGGTLQPGALSTTDMACSAGLEQQDQWLTHTLEANPTWRVDGDRLTLTSTETELVLSVPKAASLTGHKWTVESTISDDAEASVPEPHKATLTFDSDQVAINTGCNSGSAPYTVNGATLKFDPPILTKMACTDGSTDLENTILATLTPHTQFRIDAQTLTLTTDNKGLRLRTS